jgi:hypothetical protein
VLFGPYFFPFEVTSVLLIVAAIGAMLHGRRRIEDEETIDAPGPTRWPTRPGTGPWVSRNRRRDPATARSTRPTWRSRDEDPISYFLIVSVLLFTIGTVGVLVRRNALVIFMSVELQINAVNLAWWRSPGSTETWSDRRCPSS